MGADVFGYESKGKGFRTTMKFADEEQKETVRKHLNTRGHNRQNN